jgi:hypothetical protein
MRYTDLARGAGAVNRWTQLRRLLREILSVEFNGPWLAVGDRFRCQHGQLVE